jgi:hypothetical protein
MLDAFAAFAPGLSPSQRTAIIKWSRPFVIVGIPVIMVTGVWQTMENPFYRVDAFSDLQELKNRSLYGDLLFWKHVFVVATFGLTILARYIFAPRAESESMTMGGSDGGAAVMGTEGSAWTFLRLTTAVNLLACLGALMLATRMVVELH